MGLKMNFLEIYKESNENITEETLNKIKKSYHVLTGDLAYEYTRDFKTVKEIINYLIAEYEGHKKELTIAFNNFLKKTGIELSFDISNRRNRVNLAILLVLEFITYSTLYGYEECYERYPAILNAFEALGNTDELSNRLYSYLKSKEDLVPRVTQNWSNDDETPPELTQEYLFQKVYENDDMIEADTSQLSSQIDEYEALDIATCYLQDCAVSQFERDEFDSYDEWSSEWQIWFIAHCNVELDDSLVEEYKGIDPASRY